MLLEACSTQVEFRCCQLAVRILVTDNNIFEVVKKRHPALPLKESPKGSKRRSWSSGGARGILSQDGYLDLDMFNFMEVE